MEAPQTLNLSYQPCTYVCRQVYLRRDSVTVQCSRQSEDLSQEDQECNNDKEKWCHAFMDLYYCLSNSACSRQSRANDPGKPTPQHPLNTPNCTSRIFPPVESIGR